MQPRRTHDSNSVLTLPGGTEDNDLWIERAVTSETGIPVIASVWELTPEDRAEIAKGANIELIIFGDVHPPVDMRTTFVALGRPPAASQPTTPSGPEDQTSDPYELGRDEDRRNEDSDNDRPTAP